MIKEIKDIKANESFRLKDGNKTFEFTAIDDAFEGMHKSEYIILSIITKTTTEVFF